MDPTVSIAKLRAEMIGKIFTPQKMKEEIEEDNGKEGEYWESTALTYMEKAGIPLIINTAKAKIREGSGIQIKITSQDIESICSMNPGRLFPEELEKIMEKIVFIINTTGHNVSQKDGGSGVKILEICPPEIDK